MQLDIAHLVQRRNLTICLIAFILILTFSQFLLPATSTSSSRTHTHNTAPTFPSHQSPASKMGITHIVLFRFKPSASSETVKDVSKEFFGLKENCLHAESNKPYIKSVTGGTDNSPEGNSNGMTHAFVVEFETAADRDYYVHKDPVHDAFKKKVGGLLEKAQVVDFENGVFA